MSDFLDFLKQKHAYVAIGEFKPGRFAEAQRLYERAVSTYSHGFQGAYLLREPDSDRGIAFIFWNSREDMEAHQTEAHEKILQEMGHLFVSPPQLGFYHVCSEVLPQDVTVPA